MSLGTVVSLCDRTGNMVKPWIDAGYSAITLDLHGLPADFDHRQWPRREHISFDVRDMLGYRRARLMRDRVVMMFAFPPCTHLAVSGARHFQSKGLKLASEALAIVEACRDLCEGSGAPWMIENPVSTLSTYWRKPDHSFHPWQYTAFELGDNYTKKTCLWTGGGFVMPAPALAQGVADPDDRIHKAPPSDQRADFRSATPMGFARAVFEANAPRQAAVA